MNSPPALHPYASLTVGCALSAIAAIHLYWACGGRRGIAYALPRAEGSSQPLFQPGRIATAIVCVLIACAAWITMGAGNWLSTPWSNTLNLYGTHIITAALIFRTIGDFRYVGLFKKIRQTQFARADTYYYTPLCATLGTLSSASSLSYI